MPAQSRRQPANSDILRGCLTYHFLQHPGARRAAFRVGRDAPSRPPSVWPLLYEAAIDVKIFARHPPCREPFLEALPNGAAREPRYSVSDSNRLLLAFNNETSQAIFNDFGNGTSIESDHRRAAGHCFNQNQPERLGPGDWRQQPDSAAEKA